MMSWRVMAGRVRMPFAAVSQIVIDIMIVLPIPTIPVTAVIPTFMPFAAIETMVTPVAVVVQP